MTAADFAPTPYEQAVIETAADDARIMRDLRRFLSCMRIETSRLMAVRREAVRLASAVKPRALQGGAF